MLSFNIRTGTESDLGEIYGIWIANQLLATGTAADANEASTLEAEFHRLFFHSPRAVFYVAESTSGEIVGWQALLPLISNPLIGKYTAQSSTYVKRTFFQSDVGSQLFGYAISEAGRLGIDHVYAWVKTDSTAANQIARKFKGYKFEIPGTPDHLPDFNLYIIPTAMNHTMSFTQL